MLLRFLLVLLVVWVVITVIGAVVKGLFWLAVVGFLLFLATAVLGSARRR
ncbi:hypothetical protein SAMN05661080_02418 [Modestobacter sp. DSM 44400]|nr:hypothetical protein [Modestobacter sp. DSM 44400]SDY13218.1 hypothetical protein SAMN05661080_02418 [Modestobacter sp. DSM 44400]